VTRARGATAILRRHAPLGLRQALRGVLNYADRLIVWSAIVRDIRGVSQRDRRRLLLSALASPVTAWGDFIAWRNPVLLHDVDVEVPALGRFRAHARTDELYLLLPRRETAVYAAARALLRPGDTVVDAGANIGAFSVPAGRLIGSTGRLIAIEMMPQTARRLDENLARNGISAKIVQTALASTSGLTLDATLDPSRGGQATLVLGHTLDKAQRVRVTTRTLDEVLADVGEIALIKIDVEGAELDAFAGGVATLARTRAIIFEQLDGSTELATALGEAGFTISRLDHANYLAQRSAC
jgi:FkbM family methyltransferase